MHSRGWLRLGNAGRNRGREDWLVSVRDREGLDSSRAGVTAALIWKRLAVVRKVPVRANSEHEAVGHGFVQAGLGVCEAKRRLTGDPDRRRLHHYSW